MRIKPLPHGAEDLAETFYERHESQSLPKVAEIFKGVGTVKGNKVSFKYFAHFRTDFDRRLFKLFAEHFLQTFEREELDTMRAELTAVGVIQTEQLKIRYEQARSQQKTDYARAINLLQQEFFSRIN